MTNSEMHSEMLRKWASKHTSGEYCYDIDANCDECPSFIFEHCKIKEAKETEEAEAKATKGTPKGWIKLKMEAIGDDVYINTSKIVGLSVRNGASGAFTEIYTIGAKDSPWLVDESIDEVMKKIEKAYNRR